MATALLAVAATSGATWFYAASKAVEPGRRVGGGAISVLTAVALRQDVPIRKRAIGFVESTVVVNIHSRIDSQIMEQHVREGQFVKQGDLLFVLDDRDLRAQLARDGATLTRDQALMIRTQGDLVRAQQLLVKNAGTQQAVDLATSDAKAAAATVNADKATIDADRLRLSYARISATMDGRVGVVPVAPGNLVTASGGVTLATITRMLPIRVVFTLPERDLANLRTLLTADDPPTVRAATAGATTAPSVGKLTFVDSAVDTQSGTITAKATFPNTDMVLWPGQYVDVVLEAGVVKAATTVPTIAVQQGQNGNFVYVVKADSTVEPRPVTVALTDDDRTAITAGLNAGEKVVTEGQLRLRNGTVVRDTTAQPTPKPLAAAAGEIAKAAGREP